MCIVQDFLICVDFSTRRRVKEIPSTQANAQHFIELYFSNWQNRKIQESCIIDFSTNKASIKGQTLSAKVVTLKENLIYHACKQTRA